MSEHRARGNKIRARLDAWRAQIDEFEAESDSAGADVQLEYYRRPERLRTLEKEAVE